MTYTKDSFRRFFQSKFHVSQWQLLLRDYFHADMVRTSPEPLEEDAEDREGYYLGEMTTQDNYKLGFFYYDMKDVSVLRRKVGLRNLIKPYLRYGFDAALAVFSDGKFWRLSLICDLADEATNTKRFTYVFGDEKAFYKTPIARFEGLRKNADSFQAIKDAFSVEALSDDFFEEYRKQYAEFVKFLTGKRYVKKGNKWVEEEEGDPNPQFFSSFGGDEKMVRDYVKKMMGRIVFLYFLQSKGWLAGNYHYMHDLFDGSKQQDDFLDKVLEPMFFGLLNTKPEDRDAAPLVNGVGVKYIPHAEQIPYLNGGLFQQENIDQVDSRFPASMFKELFDFFDSYNFTIDENDPNDAEVGVDPEMLGKIFENLLEDNKDKGAFYTPKEIVKYMCQESLIAYLQTHESDEAVKQHIANFVKTYNVEELGGASSNLAVSIDQRLKDVKICDPAIGSGAFPMGLLRELYACRKAIEIFDADNAADIKRHIIQNNIYGVDIEKGAVDIARLRFWLALIIDEKEPMPLPNLDFKIMQGNSLLESYKGVDLSQVQKKVRVSNSKKNRGVLSLSFDEQDDMANIQRLVKQYFDITDHLKRDECRNQINYYIKDYIKKCGPAIANEVDDLEIPNDQFFLWHTYFADVFENGGFDIVIGNPPYGATLSANEKEILKKMYVDVHMRTPDTYNYFISQGMKLCKDLGVLCYIVPNTLLSQNEYEKCRLFLFQTNTLMLIANIGENVFKEAFVPTCIFLAKKELSLKYSFKYADYKDIDNSEIEWGEKMKKIASEMLLSVPSYVIGANFASGLLGKIIGKSLKIDDIAYEVAAGISTGCNRAFCLTKQQIQDNNIEFGVLKPLLIGRDIDRYSICWDSKYIIYTTKESEIELYPNAKAYILPYKDKLDKRRETKKGLIPWWALNWPRYEGLFIGEKIILRQTSDSIRATCDAHDYYPLNSILTLRLNENCGFSYKFVLGILNSTLCNYFYQNITQEKGRAFAEVKPINVRKLYIPHIGLVEQQNIIEQVVRILKLKEKNSQADTISLENKIDFLVYHLYDLTYDEVLVVDPNPSFTREEYDAYKVEQ